MSFLENKIEEGKETSRIEIFSDNFALMGMAMSGVWCYAQAMGFTKAVSKVILTATARLYIFSTIFPLAIWIISFFSIAGCLILSAIMFAIYIFPEKMVAWQAKRMLVK